MFDKRNDMVELRKDKHPAPKDRVFAIRKKLFATLPV
jgi:hypothetical protein